MPAMTLATRVHMDQARPMQTDILKMLRESSQNPELGPVISRAIAFIESAEVENIRGPNPLDQLSASVADLHAFRRRSGYYRAGAVDGLDETIGSLAVRNVPVGLAVVETRQGAVAVWLDDKDTVLGVMILTAPASPAAFEGHKSH